MFTIMLAKAGNLFGSHCNKVAPTVLRGYCLRSIGCDKGLESKKEVLVGKDENITLIGLNRPKHRNAINVRTADQLSIAISAFESDDNSPVAVLYGVGGTFSAGADLHELLEADCAERPLCCRGVTQRHTQKPIICAINGFCVAGGMELALMCDLRVMEDTAVLGFFNRRFGVPISDGGTARLGAMIGYCHALELIESGRRVTAKEALNMGLVNRVVATGTSLGQAVNLAFCIAKFSQKSLVKDRAALYSNTYDRKGFRAATQKEVMDTTRDIVLELKNCIKKAAGAEKNDPFYIREKFIPEWEKSEIEEEKSKV